jgi:hypothetical protein
MRIGIFADTHDHMDNVRLSVNEFNRRRCDLVVFAGDFVSTFVTPPLRRLQCPLIGCFGDNDGNKRGLRNGLSTVGRLAEPPLTFRTRDGVRILLTHMLRDAGPKSADCRVIIFAHTHRAEIRRDEAGCLFVNPGETSGWTYRRPSIAVLETDPLQAELIRLPEPGAAPAVPYPYFSGCKQDAGDDDSIW